MPFQIIRNDITRVAADAIVNTANPRPVVGGGTDSAVYRAAGKEKLLAERKNIGDISPGSAVSTPAFDLNARYIIHTVGPVWIDGEHGERDILHSCYANSLALAAELSCSSIAFPMIATGVYGFPKSEALDIALKEIGKFLLTHEMDITLVVFDKNSLELSEKLVGEIDKYIDEHAVGILREREYRRPYNEERRRRLDDLRPKSVEQMPFARRRVVEDETEFLQDDLGCMDSRDDVFELYDMIPAMTEKAPLSASVTEGPDESIDNVLEKKEDSFRERLFKLIDERNLDDVTVYKRANIDRKVFSKIRCNPDYQPKKATAISLAIALHLNMKEMEDLLSRAEYALSPSRKSDLIISYFVKSGNYDILEINTALFKYVGEKALLGC